MRSQKAIYYYIMRDSAFFILLTQSFPGCGCGGEGDREGGRLESRKNVHKGRGGGGSINIWLSSGGWSVLDQAILTVFQ